MVWGIFFMYFLGALITVEGAMGNTSTHLILWAISTTICPQNNDIDHLDNAICHAAPTVRACFEEHQYEFTGLLCLANSYDLKPITNLWDPLDWNVRDMVP